MGFSISAAAAIIFASMFVAFGAWYGATADSFERVTEARQDRIDDVRDTRNTAVDVASAAYNTTTDELTVEANNTGTEQLTLDGTDLLIDGQYSADWQADATVGNNGATDLWLTGETATITVSRSSAPDRVKLVADTGVSDTEEVTTVS